MPHPSARILLAPSLVAVLLAALPLAGPATAQDSAVTRPAPRPAGLLPAAPALPAAEATATTAPATSAMIPCSTRLGMPTGRCAAQITRAGAGATVTVTRPDGTTRSIAFTENRPAAGIISEQRGTLWVVEFDRDRASAERYEIPSALIEG
ncbi:MAG: hypothetical protein Q4G36_02800 [Paracoccus sp. (in: a-proteobacteria)]|nr:hypothetical protein [Paracoccus sp. (in: a-proteobacteria)]